MASPTGLREINFPMVERLYQLSLTQESVGFGKRGWEKYFGDVGVEPPLPLDIETILESPCPFWPDKKVKETHLLTLIPATVDGHPLTLNSLEQLIQNPKEGNGTKYSHYESGLREERGDISNPDSYWVLMPRDVIPGSRGKYPADQQKLITHYPHYQVSQILEAAVCVLVEYVAYGTHLYSHNPVTYATCEEFNHKPQLCEQFADGYPVCIGSFSSNGLVVSYGWDKDGNGAAPVRRFDSWH